MSEVPQPIRVLIVDDQRLIREGIAALLGVQPGIDVVACAAGGDEAIELATTVTPDVVLMDVRMPHTDGVAATTAIRQRLPACRVLMLTTFDDEAYVIDALRAGANGYLLKDLPAAELAQAVRLAHAGIDQLNPAVTARLLEALRRNETPRPAPVNVSAILTAREIEVLRLIAQGATNREIATQLTVSEGTVKNHVSNILNRLGLRDRTLAAIYARDKNLL
jgi:DNA-binding NarL/FixJ family response regulator